MDWTTFFYVVVMVAVLVGAYLTTKFISGKSKRLLKSRYIHLLDRLPLGKDKNVVLIEVGNQTLLVGVTNQSISNLGEIDSEALKVIKQQNAQKPSKGFAEQLRDFIINAKGAQENLRKARMQYKSQRQGSPADESDILSRMDEAVQQRRDRMEKGGEE